MTDEQNCLVCQYLTGACTCDLGTVDPFDDDTEIACGIENPETCESCQ